MSSTRPVNSGVRQEMFDKFQPWVLSTYGDSAKTKTITLKKAIRIQAGFHHSFSKFNWIILVKILNNITMER